MYNSGFAQSHLEGPLDDFGRQFIANTADLAIDWTDDGLWERIVVQWQQAGNEVGLNGHRAPAALRMFGCRCDA